jgi:DNA-3-methyladenine glycosylase II
LRSIIARASLPRLGQHADYLRELVVAILSQQVSAKAAQTVFNRIITRFDGFPSAKRLATIELSDLRELGVSGVKAGYIVELAKTVNDHKIDFDSFASLDAPEIITMLTALRGIGIWTVQIFLIFCMGRLDVLVAGDLGIRISVQKILGLAERPSPDEVLAIALERGWSPYCSIVCWYLWLSLSDDLLLYDVRPFAS